jgi:protein-tyrosine phosphatase
MPSSRVQRLLWVGDQAAALAPEVDAFDTVVNVTAEVPFSRLLADGVWTARFAILDLDPADPREQARMLGLLPRLTRFVRASLRAGRRTLVHCAAGEQRSCAAVCAVLMRRRGLSCDAAIAMLAARHARAFGAAGPRAAFVHFAPALRAWERELRASGRPLTPGLPPATGPEPGARR